MRQEIHDNGQSRLGISVGFVSPFAAEGLAIHEGLFFANNSGLILKVTHLLSK